MKKIFLIMCLSLIGLFLFPHFKVYAADSAVQITLDDCDDTVNIEEKQAVKLELNDSWVEYSLVDENGKIIDEGESKEQKNFNYTLDVFSKSGYYYLTCYVYNIDIKMCLVQDSNYNYRYDYVYDKGTFRTLYWIEIHVEHKVGEVYKEEISPATCGHEGSYIEITYCSICNDIINIKEGIIPLKAHRWNSFYTVDKKPTITNYGIKSVHCKVCGTRKRVTKILKTQKITTAHIKNLSVKKLKKQKIVMKLKARTTGRGRLAYKVYQYPKAGKKFVSVDKKGVIVLRKGAPKGKYSISVIARGTSQYSKKTKIVTFYVK